ncbi:MAG: HPr family phosphocarrier protein [Firmicutes bacterium]|nr:HPr family phosphocarrier protein [Bacillota bacterium]
MLEQSITIINKVGLHARPAALLVKTAGEYPCEVTLVKEGKTFNAKSILAIMSAGIKQNDTIVVKADGEGEAQALAAIVALVQSGFGEQ